MFPKVYVEKQPNYDISINDLNLAIYMEKLNKSELRHMYLKIRSRYLEQKIFFQSGVTPRDHKVPNFT